MARKTRKNMARKTLHKWTGIGITTFERSRGPAEMEEDS